MPKSKREHSDWVITKGQLARWQKEQQKRRQVIIIGSIIIAIVVILITYAIYDATKPYNPTVLKITGPQGERSFDMDYYVDMLRLYGIHQVSTSEELDSFADSVLQALERNETFRQLAAGLNISVTEEEIRTKVVDDFMASAASGTATPANPATPTYEEIIAGFSQNPLYSGVSVNEYHEVLRGEILGNKVRDYIGQREVPGEVEQANFQAIQFDTTGEPASSGTSVFIENPAEGENIDPQQIYEEIKARLQAGEDFSTLAAEFSISSSAAEPGWYPREIASVFYGDNLAEAAFTLELETLSEPIPASTSEDNTKYWIVRVHQREERPLEENHRQFMQSQAFNEWFEQQSSKFTSEIKIDDEEIREAINEALS
ncbi:MAG: peptidylprolyl isomerase [Dehalococcoidia bacterium]